MFSEFGERITHIKQSYILMIAHFIVCIFIPKEGAFKKYSKLNLADP